MQGSASGVSVSMNVLSEPDGAGLGSSTGGHSNTSSSSIIDTVSSAASSGLFQQNLQVSTPAFSLDDWGIIRL